MSEKIIECVPNFCEGQDRKIIDRIGDAICSVSGVELKCIDSGYYANRSVYTFLGGETSIFDAAYKSIETAVNYIDMRSHTGAHPRFGAIDVFPFVALKNIKNEDLIPQVEEFAKKIALDFKIPTYLYEKSAKKDSRKNLAKIRKGEYEGLENKMKNPDWIPDFCTEYNPKTGGMAMGVRNLLVAFNVNLDTKNVEIAKRIAEEIRYSGKMVNGKIVHGLCAGVKALGWYIQDFDKVQVSMNIVDILKTPVHIAFETCVILAQKYGTKVTGSELIGCIPRQCLRDAAAYFSYSQNGASVSREYIAVESMNMAEVKKFDFEKNVIDVEI